MNDNNRPSDETQDDNDTSKKLTEYELANLLAKELPAIATCGPVWHGYNAGMWEEFDRDSLRPRALRVIPRNKRTDVLSTAILNHLQGRSQIPRSKFRGLYDFDENDDILINANNGIVRIKPKERTVTLEAHSSDYMFTRKTAANYDEKAECPLYRRVLSEAVPDPEDQQLFQLCAGNFLLPDCRYEVALINYGEGGCGKSTLAEPIIAALDRFSVSRLTMAQICDPKSYHVPKLQRMVVNLGTELDAIELDDSGTFKTIVSGEPIEARPIRLAPFTMATSCKLWFLANNLPRFKHGTEAELRRMRFIRFNRKPVEKDVRLKDKLALERDGIFRWMVEGLLTLLTLREIPQGGKESKDVHARFHVSNDPVGTFVRERCELGPYETLKELMKAEYADYCEDNNLRAGAAEWFLRVLYERFTSVREVKRGPAGGQQRYLTGIRLRISG